MVASSWPSTLYYTTGRRGGRRRWHGRNCAGLPLKNGLSARCSVETNRCWNCFFTFFRRACIGPDHGACVDRGHRCHVDRGRHYRVCRTFLGRYTSEGCSRLIGWTFGGRRCAAGRYTYGGSGPRTGYTGSLGSSDCLTRESGLAGRRCVFRRWTTKRYEATARSDIPTHYSYGREPTGRAYYRRSTSHGRRYSGGAALGSGTGGRASCNTLGLRGFSYGGCYTSRTRCTNNAPPF